MALAGIFNVPSTDTELDTWAFNHMSHHRDIIRVIYEKSGVALPEYALDPVEATPGGESFDWERLHQTMHAQMDVLLGIAPFNLLGVNWRNQTLLSGWIQLNGSEHRQAGDILGLG